MSKLVCKGFGPCVIVKCRWKEHKEGPGKSVAGPGKSVPGLANVSRGGGFARKISPAGETTEGERQPHTPFHPFQGSADIEDPLA